MSPILLESSEGPTPKTLDDILFIINSDPLMKERGIYFDPNQRHSAKAIDRALMLMLKTYNVSQLETFQPKISHVQYLKNCRYRLTGIYVNNPTLFLASHVYRAPEKQEFPTREARGKVISVPFEQGKSSNGVVSREVNQKREETPTNDRSPKTAKDVFLPKRASENSKSKDSWWQWCKSFFKK